MCQDPAHPPSYSSAVASIVKNHCTPCHFPGGIVAANYDLSTYVNIVNAQTAVLSQLYACAMPPTGGDAKYGIAPGSVPAMAPAQASVIVDWILCGAPDN
jgi:hypothetical protein